MALPQNFNPAEHLQDMLTRSHNKIVRRYFADVGGDNWEPNLENIRAQLRVASTMTEVDNLEMTLLRLYLFYDVIGYGRQNLANIYGEREGHESNVTGHPKIVLFFSQDSEAVPSGKSPIRAEYSFRLVDETQSTYNLTKARSLAIEIKNLFVSNRKGIVFIKGKNQYLYFHKERGYRLRLYGNNESDAVDIIRKLLQLSNTPYEQERLTVAVPNRSNTANPGNHIVFGNSVPKPKFRPIANVRFRYAYADIPGLPKPTFLVDTTYRHVGLVGI